MILALVVGWLLQHFAAMPNAIPVAVIVGMIGALFVPVRGACSVPRQGRVNDRR